jgi:hypothetical protein
MDYIHGQRVTPLLHEMTPFERRLAEFDSACRKFHKAKSDIASKNFETPQQKQARVNDMNTELKHLKHERRFVETMAVIQAGLDNYRDRLRVNRDDTNESKANKRKSMHTEAHHGTEVLEEYLRADGRPKPSPKHTAHHIIPGKGKTPHTNLARVQLHLHGLRINDPDNGVWMCRLKDHAGHWSMPNAKSHGEIHTHNYEFWVLTNIRAASNEAMMRNSLRKIRGMLESGTQPKHVTMPPDKTWNGK